MTPTAESREDETMTTTTTPTAPRDADETRSTPRNADELLVEVESCQGRARTRLLDEADVGDYIALRDRAITLCEQYEIPLTALTVKIDGGAVANSYRDHADATWIEWSPKGDRVSRTYARHVAHGDDGRLVAYVTTGGDALIREACQDAGLTAAGGTYRID